MSGSSIVEPALAERIRVSYDCGDDSIINPYEQAAVNILLRSDSKKIPAFMRTIEDYMWFKLSFCADQRTCTSVLENLQHDVRNFMTDHHHTRHVLLCATAVLIHSFFRLKARMEDVILTMKAEVHCCM